MSYASISTTLLSYYFTRNQGYEARVKLAVLDHNAHLQRGHVTNAKGDKTYH